MCGRNKKNVFYFKLTLLRLDETSGKEEKQALNCKPCKNSEHAFEWSLIHLSEVISMKLYSTFKEGIETPSNEACGGGM